MNDMDGIYNSYKFCSAFYKINKTPFEINITKGYNLESFSFQLIICN